MFLIEPSRLLPRVHLLRHAPHHQRGMRTVDRSGCRPGAEGARRVAWWRRRHRSSARVELCASSSTTGRVASPRCAPTGSARGRSWWRCWRSPERGRSPRRGRASERLRKALDRRTTRINCCASPRWPARAVPAAQALSDGGAAGRGGSRPRGAGGARGRDLARRAPQLRLRTVRGQAEHADGRTPFVPIDESNAGGVPAREVARRAEVRPTSPRWAWVEYMLAQGGEDAGLAALEAWRAGGRSPPGSALSATAGATLARTARAGRALRLPSLAAWPTI